MSPGASQDNDDDHLPSRLPRQWLEQTYGTSPVSTLVLDEQCNVVFINDAARQLFDVEAPPEPQALGDLKLNDPGHNRLLSLIDTAITSKGLDLHFRSSAELWPSTYADVDCMPLPAPEPMVLCRVQRHERPETDGQDGFFSTLAGALDHHRRLDDAAGHLADQIYRHLHRPVILVWYKNGRKSATWTAGEAKRCHQMAHSTQAPTSDTASSVTWIDDRPGTIRISMRPADNITAVLEIATRNRGQKQVQPPSFWKNLQSSAEAILHSATIRERNRRKRHRLRAVLEKIPMAVILFDPDGWVLDMNFRARLLVDRPDWNHITEGDPPYTVRDDDNEELPRDQWPLTRAVNSGQFCEDETYVLDFGDRQRTVSVTIIPITDSRGQLSSYMATGRDVTQRSERQQRKDAFLSIASHELRGPLTPLSGLLHLAAEQQRVDEPVDPELIDRARAQVRRLERLIDGLLDLSRIETGALPIHRQQHSLTDLVRRQMKCWLDGQYGDRIDIDLPTRPLPVDLDPDRIEQVLTNILDNAIRHGRDDGAITVALSARSGEAVLTIEDEGDGIPKSIQDRIFDRYFVGGDHSQSGTGLGLYVARQIIEEHDGHISIESRRGAPTTVTIAFPLGDVESP